MIVKKRLRNGEVARANEKSICQQWQLTLIREGMTYQTLAKREPIPTVIEPTWRYRHSNPTLETIVILSNYHTYNSLHNVQPASQSTLGKGYRYCSPNATLIMQLVPFSPRTPCLVPLQPCFHLLQVMMMWISMCRQKKPLRPSLTIMHKYPSPTPTFPACRDSTSHTPTTTSAHKSACPPSSTPYSPTPAPPSQSSPLLYHAPPP
jgi:hypothetical protein